MTQKLSLLVPVRNGERHIRQTLSTLSTIENSSIIVSNNFSTDKTADILENLKVSKILKPTNPLGMIENWNFITKSCETEFFKLVSHDDLLNQETTLNQIDELNKYPDLVFVYSRRDFLFETNKRVFMKKNRRINRVSISNPVELIKEVCRTGTNPIGETICVTFRTSKVDTSDLWRDIPMVYELETYMNCLRLGPGKLVDGSAGGFRIHSRGYSASIGNFFTLASNIRLWAKNQPEFSNLAARTKFALEISSRIIAIKKIAVFAILKLL